MWTQKLAHCYVDDQGMKGLQWMLIADIQRKSGSQRGKKGEGREKEGQRESLGNFLSTVNLKQAYGFSKLSNSICGLVVEKFRQFASLRAFRGFTVNFFRIFPPRDSRGPLHTSNQRHRSSVSLENVPP